MVAPSPNAADATTMDVSATRLERPDRADAVTRRRMLGRAGALAAAGGVPTLARRGRHRSDRAWIGRFSAAWTSRVTQEKFGVTAVTNAILKAPGTPSEQFVPVLRAAVRRSSRTCRPCRGDRRQATDVAVLDPERRTSTAVSGSSASLRRRGGDRGQPLPCRRHACTACAPTRSARACARRRWGPRPSTACSRRFAASQLRRTDGTAERTCGFEPFPIEDHGGGNPEP